ncbi:RNA polymerase sigma factor [Membranihabitans marinus]|uniref:RNA polymerase sigma factor n=1 Tax=Membranihabitans marinus TaxID=1227546 RepID=UPI001F435462|nr:sigma-70 family RNA polymerase sigma factor [Membranihabitans marinus]
MESKVNTPLDIEKIFHDFNDKVYGFVLKNVGNVDLAKDITQEIFLKVCLRKDRLAEIEDVSNYIYLMARNSIIDHFRKAAHETDYRKTLKEDIVNPVEQTIKQKHYATVLDDALELLPPRQKTIFVMHRQQGQSLKEISKQLGISYFTVKNHLAEAGKNLKKVINPEIMYSLIVIFFNSF